MSKILSKPSVKIAHVQLLGTFHVGSLDYDDQVEHAVENVVPAVVKLQAFRREAQDLSRRVRKTADDPAQVRWEQWGIVRQALILLEQNYVHLPMKRVLHAVDPVQRLKVLLSKLAPDEDAEVTQTRVEPVLSDEEFHRELLEAFLSLRDPHTYYRLPTCYHGQVAFLPFMVEDVGGDAAGPRKYIVSKVLPEFPKGTFARGVEVLYWNGMPIERAVWDHAQHCTGSNRDARRAEALISLTLRDLSLTPQPDHDWVVVHYRTAKNENPPLEQKFYWRVGADPRTKRAGLTGEPEMNPALATMKMMQLALFAPEVLNGKCREGDIRTKYLWHFSARACKTRSGVFGYLRIWNFALGLNEREFVNEFIRLIEHEDLPKDGLIIDIRENPGGKMNAAEYILQTLTPARIEPQPLQFINTPLNLKLCTATPPAGMPDLKRWRKAIREGLQTGAVYSAAFPKEDRQVQECNVIGQKYFGPVMLITDALSYSAADMFAAGFQDHHIGSILGTDGRTGGGGANTWEYEKYRKYNLAEYRALPYGVSFNVAIRRSLRVGIRAGAVLEDFGVEANVRHAMTTADVLFGNKDLIETAAKLLADIIKDRPVRAISVKKGNPENSEVEIKVITQGISRIDVYVDDRPIDSANAGDKPLSFVLNEEDSRSVALELRGFDGQGLVARYRPNTPASTVTQ